jgi:hypothetical protein
MNKDKNETIAAEDFPQPAIAMLDAFYKAKGVFNGTVKDKINAFRGTEDFKDAIIAADGGVPDDSDELKTIEFIYLSKLGVLN